MRRTSSDHTLGEVIADYFRRINRGESPDAQAYIQRYPAWADELRKFFEQSACLDSFIREAGLRDDTHAPAADAAGECPPAGHEDTDDGDPSLPSVTGYRILEEVGAGGQGVVYKAEQLGTRRTVALKVIRDGAFATQAERRRFRSEAELAARLTHPNIVSVYASGQDRRHDYFAMQYVDGEPLDTYLATVSRSLDAVVTLFLEVCEAVAYAHRHGVLHRDLKPSNILVDASGTPHIVDFGLAKTVSDPASGPADYATRVGEFAGTWHYASPEQAKLDPAAVDVRSDVYTLGVILYEMLTHQLPYPVDNETREAVARHILETPPIRPSMLRREIDDDLETVMLTALQKDPDRRYQSAAALADDIKRCLADDAIAAKRDSTFYVLRKTLQRHRGRVAAATGCLAALIAFAVTIAVLYTRMRSARATTEAHMVLERLGQPHEMDKLSELNFYVSRLNEFTDTYPTSPLTRRVSAEAFDNAGALLADAIVDAPADIHLTARAPDNPDYDRAIAWLAANEPELADIERRARERRFTFGVVRQAGSDRADFVAAADLAPGATAVTVMIARAYRWSRMGDHGAATRSLQAARSIAVDIADGRLVTHKTRSIVLRAK
ncbi:MAG: serine/threonine-protein kinase, partial [Phycisphaerae bacterium]